MDTGQRFCLECNDVLRGRADQKFCSDACRNAYNNKLNRDTTAVIRNISNSLRRNRRILQGFFRQNKSKISRSMLAGKGFNFKYHTHSFVTKKGNNYFFCFDYGYLPLEDELYLIVEDIRQKSE